MKFIICDIYDFIGQCGNAKHFYADVYYDVDYDIDKSLSILADMKYCSNRHSLTKLLTFDEAFELNEIDDSITYFEGTKCSRFNSIEEIHKTLIDKYPESNIIIIL